jgi:hypothetical protein
MEPIKKRLTKAISDDRIQELIGWKPHLNQEPVLKSVKKNRETVLCAGRRFGKSALCAYLALKELLKDGKHVWVVSPSYDLSRKVFAYVQEWVGKGFPSLLAGLTSRPNPKIITPWGSWIELKSADEPQSLLGEELDLLIVDEASRIKKDVYERYLYPTTSSRKGKIVFISTPFGKNWFYDKFVENKSCNGSFQFTSKDGLSITEDEFIRAKDKLPRSTFEQEYLSQFNETAASVFRGVRDIIRNTLKDPRPGHRYTLGLDLAKFHDFTVITVVDNETHEVVYHDRFQQVPYTLQREKVINVALRYCHAKIVAEVNNVGAAFIDDLKAAGCFVEPFNTQGTISKDITKKGSKERLIEKLSVFIQDRNVWIPPIDCIVDELESYGCEISDSGNYKYGAPPGGYDDCVISLALSVWNLTNKARTVQIEAARAMPKVKRKFIYK